MKALLKNTAVLSIGTVIVGLTNYAFHPIMARFLSVEQFGEFQSVMALIYIFGIPAATAGMIISKKSAEYMGHNELGKVKYLLHHFNKIFLKIGAAGSIILLIAATWISQFLGLESTIPVLILAISFPLTFLSFINLSVLQGLHRFGAYTINTISGSFARIGAGATLGYLGYGTSGAILAATLASLIPYAISFIQLKDLPEKSPITKETIKKIQRYAVPTFFMLLFATMLYSWDIILVKHLASAKIAGNYSALSIFGKMILFASGSVPAALFPMAATMKAQGKQQLTLVLQALTLVAFCGGTLTILFHVFSTTIVNVLLGSTFLDIAPYLSTIAIVFTLLSLTNTLISFFVSTEKQKAFYMLGIALLIMTLGIYKFHSNLSEIINIILATQAFTFLSLLAYLTFDHFKTRHEQSDITPIANI